MEIILDSNYKISHIDTSFIGRVGEIESRNISVQNYICDGADSYKIRIMYNDGSIIDIPLVEGIARLYPSVFREYGYVSLQIFAVADDDVHYTYQKISDKINVIIGESLGKYAPIPTYEQSVEAYEKVLSIESHAKEYAEQASRSASMASSAEAGAGHYAKDAGTKSVAAAESARIAKEAQDVVVPASEAATKASEDAERYSRTASFAATNASAFNDAAQQAASSAEESKESVDTRYTEIIAASESTEANAHLAEQAKNASESFAKSALSAQTAAGNFANDAISARNEAVEAASSIPKDIAEKLDGKVDKTNATVNGSITINSTILTEQNLKDIYAAVDKINNIEDGTEVSY